MEWPHSLDAGSLILPQTCISLYFPGRHLPFPCLEIIRASLDSWFEFFVVCPYRCTALRPLRVFARGLVLEPPTQESHSLEGYAHLNPGETPLEGCLGSLKLPF